MKKPFTSHTALSSSFQIVEERHICWTNKSTVYNNRPFHNIYNNASKSSKSTKVETCSDLKIYKYIIWEKWNRWRPLKNLSLCQIIMLTSSFNTVVVRYTIFHRICLAWLKKSTQWYLVIFAIWLDVREYFKHRCHRFYA